MDKPITIKDKEAFADSILEKLILDDLFSKTKSDICETLISITNECSDDFLVNKSNYELSNLLRIRQSRVKTLKETISLRFLSQSKRDEMFCKFLDNLYLEDSKEKSVQGKYLVYESSTNPSVFKLCLEDNVLRNELERRLKETTNKTLDCSFNKEVLEIPKDAFVKMLASIYAPEESTLYNSIERLSADIQKTENNKFVESTTNYLSKLILGEKGEIALNAITSLIVGG